MDDAKIELANKAFHKWKDNLVGYDAYGMDAQFIFEQAFCIAERMAKIETYQKVLTILDNRSFFGSAIIDIEAILSELKAVTNENQG